MQKGWKESVIHFSPEAHTLMHVVLDRHDQDEAPARPVWTGSSEWVARGCVCVCVAHSVRFRLLYQTVAWDRLRLLHFVLSSDEQKWQKSSFYKLQRILRETNQKRDQHSSWNVSWAGNHHFRTESSEGSCDTE